MKSNNVCQLFYSVFNKGYACINVVDFGICSLKSIFQIRYSLIQVVNHSVIHSNTRINVSYFGVVICKTRINVSDLGVINCNTRINICNADVIHSKTQDIINIIVYDCKSRINICEFNVIGGKFGINV